MANARGSDAQELEKLKLLFEYTKFHIGLYTTLGTGLVAVLAADFAKNWRVDANLMAVAIVAIAVAGFAGGVVASTLTQHTSHYDFWTSETGPFRRKWWSGEAFTYIEHTAFWIAVVAGLLAVWFGREGGSAFGFPREVTMEMVVALMVGAAIGAGIMLLLRRKGGSADEGPLLAVIAWDEGVAYVSRDHRDVAARAYHVADPAQEQWTIRGYKESMLCTVVLADAEWLASVPAVIGNRQLKQGMTCGNNDRPPGSDNTGCIRQPGGVNKWMERVQDLGYRYCVRGAPGDQCDQALVKVGEWIYYSDRCATETHRQDYNRWVCFP